MAINPEAINDKPPQGDWKGKDRRLVERRATCLIHHDTIKEIYSRLVDWKTFLLIVSLAAAVVGGTNLLVQNSVKDTKIEISAAFKDMKKEVERSNEVLHRRISEGNEERSHAIEKLGSVMNDIDKKLNIWIIE